MGVAKPSILSRWYIISHTKKINQVSIHHLATSHPSRLGPQQLTLSAHPSSPQTYVPFGGPTKCWNESHKTSFEHMNHSKIFHDHETMNSNPQQKGDTQVLWSHWVIGFNTSHYHKRSNLPGSLIPCLVVWLIWQCLHRQTLAEPPAHGVGRNVPVASFLCWHAGAESANKKGWQSLGHLRYCISVHRWNLRITPVSSEDYQVPGSWNGTLEVFLGQDEMMDFVPILTSLIPRLRLF